MGWIRPRFYSRASLTRPSMSDTTRVSVESAKLGFSSATELLRAHEGKTYAQVCELMEGIVPIALTNQARREAEEASEQWWFVADSAVREIRSICAWGWRCGESGEFKAAHALGAWAATVEPLGPEWFQLAVRVGDLLFADQTIPVGWLPENLQDEFVSRAMHAASN